VLLLLAGMGNDAHSFDQFAPKFTDRFRVLALTRRGFGQSDKPATGYDTDTLVADSRAFLDMLKIKRVSLIGHSFAGWELIRFAELYPDRVDRLVFLDCLQVHRPGGPLPPGRHIAIGPDAIFMEMMWTSYASDMVKISKPALSFFTFRQFQPGMDERTFNDNFARRHQEMENLKRNNPHMRIVAINGDHYDFIHNDEVVREIRMFLLGK
jgi:pimeloyl-ACP methyl ester carboxylesterase